MSKKIQCSHTKTEDPGALIPHPKNPNTHPPAQVDLLAKVIKHQGWRNPIVVSKRSGFVIAGHARLKAAIALGLDQVPVDYQEFETEADEWTHLVADNKLAELADPNDSMLAELLQELTADGVDLELTGFGEDDLSELLGELEEDKPETDAEPQTDKADELRDKWDVKQGQVWSLGNHRLICGDSTDRDVVDRVLPGDCDLCFTDPPYGVEYEYNQHDDTREGLIDLIAGFLPIAKDKAKVVALTPGHSQVHLYPQPEWILCWFYGAGTGRGPWGFSAWQPLLVYGKDPKLANGEGAHPDALQLLMTRDDASQNRELAHSCPKPLSVWVRFLKRLSNKKTKTVFEPFCGSGTTVIACENLGLACHAVEIDPAYCAVTIQRWADATGGDPKVV